VETAHSFDEVPPLMRSDVDLIALDGHGWVDGVAAYFGTNDDLRVCPSTLRGELHEGIVAPIVMFGFCWGGREPFRNAVEGTIDRSQVAFVGCIREAKYNDAERIYPPLLSLLAQLGNNPDPAHAHANIKLIEPTFGSAWRADPLLQRRPS
jgi:dienelactone hydrolase